uniref:Uncharacterized protein n=1 Tax=Gopherus agassizii TaxID=38772 RepID=A0A452H5Q8_9SAUR
CHPVLQPCLLTTASPRGVPGASLAPAGVSLCWVSVPGLRDTAGSLAHTSPLSSPGQGLSNSLSPCRKLCSPLSLTSSAVPPSCMGPGSPQTCCVPATWRGAPMPAR